MSSTIAAPPGVPSVDHSSTPVAPPFEKVVNNSLSPTTSFNCAPP